MTVKAGQKCTAIRRAFVPRERMDDVVEADPRGWPRSSSAPRGDGVTMGALASLDQRQEVLRAVKTLRGVAELVFGDPDDFEVVGADKDRGAFLPPMLLRCDDLDAAEPHDVEAFGPVSTVLPYDGVAHAVELAARGQGSLVGSIVTHDRAFAPRGRARRRSPGTAGSWCSTATTPRRTPGTARRCRCWCTAGPAAPAAARRWAASAACCTTCSAPPSRPTRDMLTAVSGRWVTGARRNDDGVHPFRKPLAELRIGDSVTAGPRPVTLEDIEHFAEFTGDTFYAHMDEEAAAANPLFGGRVAHGYLIVSWAAGLFVDPDPGPVLANYGVDNLRFLTPVKLGDELTVTLTAKQISPRGGAEHGEVRWDADVVNSAGGESVARYDVLTKGRRGGGGAGGGGGGGRPGG